MKRILITGIVLISSVFAFAIIPPKTGVKPTESFLKFHKMIQSHYSEGYYAKKFRERKQLRESAGEFSPQSTLGTDTTFALTLMGQYKNLSGGYTQQNFQQLLFDGPNPTGTVTDYYNQISYGQLQFTGTCFGWYNMPRTLDEYVGDNNGLGVQGGARFVLDIVKIADSTLNFADYIQYYDNSGNPHIGFIAVVHSGGDAAQGAHNIWSHRWSFIYANNNHSYTTNDIDPVSGKNVIIDGDYAIEPERSGSNNTNGPLISIGVFTHEFGHIFGLPDLYDTDNSSEGLGNWCLMAGGAYGGNGSSANIPVQLSAWCKYQLGWVTPINITNAMQSLIVPNVEENQVIYRMWKNGSTGLQYFLIENRQQIANDINIYTPGFLIYHVDESRSSNTDENHYLVDLEQADGLHNLNLGQGRGDAGDPFPGSRNNTRFDYDTNPNSKDYSSQNTFVSVRNIHKSGTDMIADLDIGSSPYLEVKNISLEETDYQNGRIEQGEACTLGFTIENLIPVNSENTTLSYSLNANGIEIIHNELTTTVSGGTTQTFFIDSAFYVSPNFNSNTLSLKYEIIGTSNVINDSINIVIGVPPILIISKAEADTLIRYYTSSLTKINQNFEYSLNEDPPFIYRRKAIIIFMGKSVENILSQAEIDSLSSFIDNGGNVMFTGQNLAEYFENNSSEFLHNKIGIKWESNMPFPQYVYGVNDDLFGSQFSTLKIKSGDGASNQLGPDVLAIVDSSFHFSHTYKTDGTKPAGGWINKPNGAKIIFWGFGFESINNNESSITRSEVLNSILQWFNGVVNVPYENTNTPLEYNLSQNFPNPFNPETNISYQIPVKGNVTIKIYNVLGKEVQTLVDELKDAGTYKLHFDASSLSSGVYFYRIKTGTFIQTKKMIVLR